jgi:H+/Cl- antiporter ClcA
MRQTIAEETILFASVVKWVVLASFMGGVVGLAAVGFLSLLSWATGQADKQQYVFLFMPFAFFVSALLTQYLAPDAKGHGTEKVIEAVHRRASVIPIAVVPVKLLATVVTLAAGGSAGKEGPCAQIGAGLASFFAQVFRFDENDRKKLVICGISAGFASVFGTPIAGAIFGVEVLFVGGLLYDVLLPSFVAGMVAYQVSALFGICGVLPAPLEVPAITGVLFVKVLMAAAIFGVFSLLLIKGLQMGGALFARVRIWAPFKAALGGAILIALALVFGRQYLGLGTHTIDSCLRGETVSWAAPFLKIVFTSITLGCGGSGGVVTPIFFVGASAGSAVAHLLGMNPEMMSAIGLVCLLAGAANTPIAASIMAVELFGSAVGPYAAVACVVSYLMTGHRSVYPSQVIAVRKSASLNVELGREMRQIEAVYQHRKHTLADYLLTLWEAATGKWKKGGRA